jgi:hypothetical protein
MGIHHYFTPQSGSVLELCIIDSILYSFLIALRICYLNDVYEATSRLSGLENAWRATVHVMLCDVA